MYNCGSISTVIDFTHIRVQKGSLGSLIAFDLSGPEPPFGKMQRVISLLAANLVVTHPILMPRIEDWKDLRERLSVFGVHTLSIFVDCIFLILWAVLHWAVNELIHRIFTQAVGQPHNDWEDLIIRGGQIVFAISTLAVILIHMYQDISLMGVRANQTIEEEKGKKGRTRRRKDVQQIEGEKSKVTFGQSAKAKPKRR